ncbi:hypothetical protein CRUP_004665, partial [Coryphaenoides rupestris]
MPANKDDGGWRSFVWNSERGELLGRTGGSWCLSHTPRSEKTELYFSPKDSDTYRHYTRDLRELMAKYDEENQRDQMLFEDCGDVPSDYRHRGELESEVGVRKACRFSRSLLGECSGLEDPDFGFKQGRPCIIIKLNRIVNFRPRPPLNNGSIPEDAHYKVLPNVMPIYCSNKRPEDADKIGEIKYFGIGGGFPLQYYPFYGKLLHSHYLQPLVALQFTNLTHNTELRVECKVYGDNIAYSDKDRYQGRFDIKFTITKLDDECCLLGGAAAVL